MRTFFVKLGAAGLPTLTPATAADWTNTEFRAPAARRLTSGPSAKSEPVAPPVPGDRAYIWVNQEDAGTEGGLAASGVIEWIEPRDRSIAFQLSDLCLFQKPLLRFQGGRSLTERFFFRGELRIPEFGFLERIRRNRPNKTLELRDRDISDIHSAIVQLDAGFYPTVETAPHRCWLDANNETARIARLTEVWSRPAQRAFSAHIRQIYHNRCAVTGCTTPAALQAAHIRTLDGSDANSPTNGILLRADLHLMFDAHLITLSEDGSRLEVCNSLNDPSYDFLRVGTVSLPTQQDQRPSAENIRHHRERFERARGM
ncbi:HNH endonuclease [Bradyrhizobium diazoefficiens]|nr:HNH endonuclease signature motif containing protein [Bradyrhizobium diazoefficiens]MBR0852151.1 HNH endonuclease [Bradyrhizobium diazoefficiens]